MLQKCRWQIEWSSQTLNIGLFLNLLLLGFIFFINLDEYIFNQWEESKLSCFNHVIYLPVAAKGVNSCLSVLAVDVKFGIWVSHAQRKINLRFWIFFVVFELEIQLYLHQGLSFRAEATCKDLIVWNRRLFVSR